MYPAIAIDGPAASGKSTVAKRVAKELGYVFVNTGAMYRAVTWYALSQGVAPSDSAAVEKLLNQVPLEFGRTGTESVVLCEGRVLNEELTAPEVNANVSVVAAIPAVREMLVKCQRDYNEKEAVVMEGRDIGTAVFPDTPFKYFVTASEEVREARRAAQGIKDSVKERDRQDSSRDASPLVQAPGAVLIDTSHMTIDEVVETVVRDIRTKMDCL